MLVLGPRRVGVRGEAKSCQEGLRIHKGGDIWACFEKERMKGEHFSPKDTWAKAKRGGSQEYILPPIAMSLSSGEPGLSTLYSGRPGSVPGSLPLTWDWTWTLDLCLYLFGALLPYQKKREGEREKRKINADFAMLLWGLNEKKYVEVSGIGLSHRRYKIREAF